MEHNEEGYVVRLSENALISLILNGLEAYSVCQLNTDKKHDRVKLETFGHLFGHEVHLSDGKIVYQIEIVNTDTSAGRASESVAYSRDAIALKIDTISSFWPNLEYLGDFHSHPYDNYQKAVEVEGYFLSDGDRKDLADNSSFWSDHNHRVGLLLTIGAMKRAGSKEPCWIDYHCVEFNLGNFKLWITAYCSYLKKGKMFYTSDSDSPVILDCSALTGLVLQKTAFGKIMGTGQNVKFVPSN